MFEVSLKLKLRLHLSFGSKEIPPGLKSCFTSPKYKENIREKKKKKLELRLSQGDLHDIACKQVLR